MDGHPVIVALEMVLYSQDIWINMLSRCTVATETNSDIQKPLQKLVQSQSNIEKAGYL
jgi:hypothetical protein